MRAARTITLLSLSSLLSGCFVFDSQLYMIDGGTTFSPSETCETGAPVLDVSMGASVTFAVDTMANGDDTRDTVACTGSMESGPDVFVSVDPDPGDRWHFHVRVDRAAGGADPAIYALTSGCDPRDCQGGDGTDTCGAGSDEHFTYVADASGSIFRVAFDSVDVAGFRGNVEVYRTFCGNGMAEHGESCDDGDDDDLVCDGECRSVLSGASVIEDEVNDDIYMANYLAIAAGASMSVRGEIVNLCEVDVYAIDVPAGASITAALRNEGGGACDATAESTELELVELTTANNPRLRVAGTVPTGEICPAIDSTVSLAQNLPAGTYYLRVRNVLEGDARPSTFRYQLDVTLAAP
jgi:hypothetical protein